MSRHFLIILVLTLIIFSSGCTIFPSSTKNDVIVIKSLESIPSAVSPGQKIKIISYVQNLGNEKKQVKLTLYFSTDFFKLIVHENEKSETLLPKQIKEVVWNLEVRELSLRRKVELKVRANYKQETTSLTTIKLISYTQEHKQTTPETKFGEGPVKAYIKIDKHPIPVVGEKTIIDAELYVENQGSGRVEEIKELEINPPKNWKFENGIEGIGKNIVFIQGKSPPIPLRIKAETEDIKRETTELITTKIIYDYEIEKETTITITP